MLPSYDFVWILMKSFIQISTTNVNEQFRTWTNIQRLFRPLSELERSWASLSERNIRLLSIFKTWSTVSVISVLIPVMIPARKQRCVPYEVDKVYFFAVQCRISSATKTSVNGPTRLNFRSDNLANVARSYGSMVQPCRTGIEFFLSKSYNISKQCLLLGASFGENW